MFVGLGTARIEIVRDNWVSESLPIYIHFSGSKLTCNSKPLVDQSSPDFFIIRRRNFCSSYVFPILDIQNRKDVRTTKIPPAVDQVVPAQRWARSYQGIPSPSAHWDLGIVGCVRSDEHLGETKWVCYVISDGYWSTTRTWKAGNRRGLQRLMTDRPCIIIIMIVISNAALRARWKMFL